MLSAASKSTQSSLANLKPSVDLIQCPPRAPDTRMQTHAVLNTDTQPPL